MRAFSALMLDAYRELNARRLFWVSLFLSVFIVSVLWLIGITPNHTFKVFIWDTHSPVPPFLTLGLLLKGIYISFGVKFWLTWASAILALISTASIFPEFMAGGAIDLVLSKPISRLRLFFIKYLGGLLFAALQVALFSLACFLTIGIRTGDWAPGIFLAIPLVVAFFSYLFCVCVFIGVLTRSTLMSLLATILFWLCLFVINSTDQVLLMPRVVSELYVEHLEKRVDNLKSAPPSIAPSTTSSTTPSTTPSTSPSTTDSPENSRLKLAQDELKDAVETRDSWAQWHGLIVDAKTTLPKTAETIDLLNRYLMRSVNIPEQENAETDRPNGMLGMNEKTHAAGVREIEVVNRMKNRMESRPIWWVLGTSLIFEAITLALAAWIFCRRDY